MADEHGDYLYSQWLQRKASAMRRPVLSCGCRNDGRPTYVRGTCDCIVCREHRDDEHEHPEEPKKVEALRLPREPVDLSLGARHHLTGGEYQVTVTDSRNATLTPVDRPAPPWMTRVWLDLADHLLILKPWWKPNTWRRNG